MPKLVAWNSIVVIQLASSYVLASSVDTHWLSRFTTEGKASLERYRLASSEIDETCELIYRRDPSALQSQVFRTGTHTWRSSRLNGNCMTEVFRTVDDLPGKPIIQLDGFNDYYAFSLKKNDAQSPFALIKTTPGKATRKSVGYWMHENAYSLLEQIIAACENRDGYSLKAIQWDDKKQLVHATIAFDGRNNAKQIVRQEIFLDPQNDWRIMEWETYWLDSHSTYRLTYGITVNNLTFPTAMENSNKHESKSSLASNIITGKLIQLEKTKKTAADFRLPAFGISEPDHLRPRTANTWWLVCGLIAVCLVVMIWQVKVARTRKLLAKGISVG